MRKLRLSQNLIFSSLNTISVRWRCLGQMMLSRSDDAISVRCCQSQLYISRSDDAVYLSWLSVPISSQHTTAEISNSVDFHNKFFSPLKRPRNGKNCFTVKMCWQKNIVLRNFFLQFIFNPFSPPISPILTSASCLSKKRTKAKPRDLPESRSLGIKRY